MVYKTSHGQVFHLNSKSQICHKLILQVISHQIKDNAHNHHGSIGLFKVGFVGTFGLGCFGLSFFWCEWKSGHKNLASNLNGRPFPIPSCFDQVVISLPFYSLQQLRTWFRYLFIPKNSFFSFHFAFCSFPSLIDFFLFLLFFSFFFPFFFFLMNI